MLQLELDSTVVENNGTIGGSIVVGEGIRLAPLSRDIA